MVISGVLAFVGLVLPYVIVPIRRNAGLPTYQWDSDTSTNPVRSPCAMGGSGAGLPCTSPLPSPSPLFAPLRPLLAPCALTHLPLAHNTHTTLAAERSTFQSGASMKRSTLLTMLRCWPSGPGRMAQRPTDSTTRLHKAASPSRALGLASLRYTALHTRPYQLHHCTTFRFTRRAAKERLEAQGKLH